jgi:transglutaminase-like putative cysteine protease
MERIAGWLRLREGWLMVGLLALMLFSVTWSVQRAEWAEGLRILSLVTLSGLVTGLILSKVRGVPRVLLHATGLTMGVLTVLWLTANLIESPDLPTIQDKTQDLLGKIVTWVSAVASGDVSDDIWMFVLSIAGLSFLLAYSSAWFLLRSRWLWWALIPSGIALAVNLSYATTPGLNVFFVLYLITALLLMVRFNMLLHEERWDRERVNYSPSLRWSFLWVGSLFAGFVAVSMWFVPPQAVNTTLNAAWERVNGPWIELQSRFGRAFSGVNGGGNFGYSSFNTSWALGSSLNLGDAIVLRVKSDVPLRWRVITQDQWNGFGWGQTNDENLRGRNVSSKLSLDANQPLFSADLARRPVTMTFTVVQPKRNDQGFNVFAPMRPVESNLATRLDVSWEERDVTVRVPGDDPNTAPLELRPLLSLLADVRRAATQTPTAGQPANDTRLLQIAAHEDPEVNTLVSGLGDRGINLTYELLGDRVFAVHARGLFPQYDDITAVYSQNPIERGAQYSFVAAVSTASEQALRAASTDYPDWVRQRYLQLPAHQPARIADLARQITSEAGATTAYDKAKAIEAYLRANYKYDTHVTRPPPGTDYVDYFLFENKSGFCEYYSTAMVVMLRTLGIAAREATGFAPGEQDKASGEYVVRESSSHAWPEVYFPEYGWIEFEPTPSQGVIYRPSTDADPSLSPTAGIPLPDEALGQHPTDRAVTDGPDDPVAPANGGLAGLLGLGGNGGGAVGGGLLLLVGGVGLFWLVRRRQVERSLAAGLVTTSAAAYYERLLRFAWWIGLRPRPSETPFEFADDVGHELPGSRTYVKSIANAYVNERFGRRKLEVADQRHLDVAWREVRRRIMRRMSHAGEMLSRLVPRLRR